MNRWPFGQIFDRQPPMISNDCLPLYTQQKGQGNGSRTAADGCDGIFEPLIARLPGMFMDVKSSAGDHTWILQRGAALQ